MFKSIYKQLDKIIKKYTFEQIINFNYTKYDDIYNEIPFETLFCHLTGYVDQKERYEKYFKIKYYK